MVIMIAHSLLVMILILMLNQMHFHNSYYVESYCFHSFMLHVCAMWVMVQSINLNFSCDLTINRMILTRDGWIFLGKECFCSKFIKCALQEVAFARSFAVFLKSYEEGWECFFRLKKGKYFHNERITENSFICALVPKLLKLVAWQSV